MALTADKRLEAFGSPSLRMKKLVPGFATTFYVGEIVGIEPSQGYAKPISGSAEAGYQVVGVVTRQQTIAANGDKLEVEQGPFLMSGSGFTADEQLKIVYASSPTNLQDTHSAGYHAIGRLVMFGEPSTLGSSTGNNIVVNVGVVRSGTTI